jgi:WD40 repeat protein
MLPNATMTVQPAQDEWTLCVQPAPVRVIAASPRGSLLAVTGGAADEGWVQIRSAHTGELLFSYGGHSTPVGSLAFSPVGTQERIASASRDGDVQIWDAATGECFLNDRGHTHAVRALSWSPDGRLLASGSSDGTVRVWNVWSGGSPPHFTLHAGGVWSLAWSPGGRLLASGGNGVRLHRLNEAGQVCNSTPLPISTFGNVLGLDFFPDSSLLALAGVFPHMEVWDTDVPRLWNRYPSPALLSQEVMQLTCRPVSARCMTLLSREGDRVPLDCTLRLWQVAVERVSQRPFLERVIGISACAWLDPRTVVVGTASGVLLVRHVCGLDG